MESQSPGLVGSAAGGMEYHCSCGGEVKDNEDALLCQWCNEWRHLGCTSTTRADFAWYCSVCQPIVKENLKVFGQMRRDLDEAKVRVRNVETKVVNVEGRVEKLEQRDGVLEGKVDELKNKVFDVHQTIENVVNVKLEDAMKEESEKTRKRANIMIHNLPEISSTDVEKRKRWGVRECVKVFNEYLGVATEQQEVVRAVRMGKRDDTGNKPRLLSVTLNSVGKKFDIISKAPKLKTASEEGIKKLFITRDMTLKERNEERKLRDELRKRRDEGETDLMIRRGKIVKKPGAQGSVGTGEGDLHQQSRSLFLLILHL